MQSTARTFTIALEEHISLPEMTRQIAGKSSNRSPFSLDEVKDKLADITGERVQSMDDNGIDMQVLSVVGPGADLLDRADAPAFCERYNDTIANIIAPVNNRFLAFAHLPMQDPEAAAIELERTAGLHGFKGTLINGLTGGGFLDEPKFAVLLEKAAMLHLPLYLHPGLPPRAVSDAYYAQLPKQAGNILSLAGWGWHAETALHILRMILAGTFDKFPGLTVIIGHMGEMLPVMMARCDNILGVGRAGENKRSVSNTLKDQVFITTSGIFTQIPFRAALETFGIDNIMFSVDYPFAGNKEGKLFLDQVDLSEEDKTKLRSGNAKKILKIL